MLSEKHWDPNAVLQLAAGVFTALAAGWVLAAVLNQALGGLNKPDQQLLQFAVSAVSFQGAALVLIQLFLRQQRLTWTEAFGFNSPRLGRTLWLAILCGLIILGVALELGVLISEMMIRLGIKPEPQAAVQLLQGTVSTGRRVFYGAVAVLAAPVAEELLFRGIVYPTIKQAGHPRLAFWGTSLLFAGIHFNLLALIPLLFIAVMLTLLYEETNNLLAPILAHAIFNAANFVVLLQAENFNRVLQTVYERI